MTDAHVNIEGVSIWYGKHQVLRDISVNIPKHSIYAFIGPSGCGKTTLLRSLNRMNDFVNGFRLSGRVSIDGADIYADKGRKAAEALRRRVGMVFQQPNPLPTTIRKNMNTPITEHYRLPAARLNQLAELRLKECALFDEVTDKLDKPAFALSGGQQQRLCIARALMLEPSVILFDEPCSALDPISTFKIEELLTALKADRTIIIVTHNMEQARRIADYTAFFYNGDIVAADETYKIFNEPDKLGLEPAAGKLLENYVRGRF